jgi:hypothetical protein
VLNRIVECGMERLWVLAVLAVVLVLASCTAAEDGPCPEGEIVDFSGVCVPDACGTERFPAVPDDAPAGLPVVYVSEVGSNRDGRTPDTAKRQISSALVRVARDREPTVVLVAAGTYEGNLEVDQRHDGLWLVGRCPELVAVESEDGAPGLNFVAEAATVRGLTLRGGTYGVLVANGDIDLRSTTIDRAESIGAVAFGGKTRLTDVLVQNTRPLADGRFGRGINVESGAHLSCLRCRLKGNSEVGILLGQTGTEVVLRDVEIWNTQAWADGGPGVGLLVQAAGTLSGRGIRVVGSSSVGVQVLDPGSKAVLRDLVVQQTGGSAMGSSGIAVALGAHLECRGCRLSGNHEVGIRVGSPGTEVILHDVEVHDTEARSVSMRNAGIAVLSGSRLVCNQCRLDGNSDVGLYVEGVETEAVLTGVRVTDTRPVGDEISGFGVEARVGASLQCTDCELRNNSGAGVLASDKGTEVSLSDAEVSDTQPLPDGTAGIGVLVAWAAHLDCLRCSVDGNTPFGVRVEGDRSQARLVESVVRNTRAAPDGRGGQGVSVISGGRLSCTLCVLEDNLETGLSAFDPGTEVVLRDLEVRDTRAAEASGVGVGLAVSGGAALSCSRCKILGTAGKGVSAIEPGTVVVLEDVEIRDPSPSPLKSKGSRGIHVEDGAQLRCAACRVDGNSGVGVFAASDAVVSLWDSEIVNTRPSPHRVDSGRGISVQGGAWLGAVRCLVEGNRTIGVFADGAETVVSMREVQVRNTEPTVEGNGGRGINVQAGAQLECTACLVEGNAEAGIYAAGRGTKVTLKGTEILDSRPSTHRSTGIGIFATQHGVVDGRGLSVRGSAGAGALVTSGGSLLLKASSIEESGFAGVAAIGASTLIFEGGRLAGTTPGTSDGGGVGLFAWGANAAPRTSLRNVRFLRNPVAGAFLRGAGAYSFDACAFSGSGGLALNSTVSVHGHGVVATEGVARWDGAMGLIVDGSLFDGNARADVLLDGSTGTLGANNVGAGSYSVQQQGCDPNPPLEVERLDADLAEIRLCQQPEDLVLPLAYRFEFEEVALDPMGL